MNLKKRKTNVTEIVLLLLKPDIYVSNPYFPSMLKENTEIQAAFGADNTETYEYVYRGWTISFKPDQILDDVLIEFKVKRPYTREKELHEYAYLQALLQAYMLNLPRFKIIITYHNPAEGRTVVEFEKEYETTPSEAERFLDAAVVRLEALREILTPVKIVMRE